LGFLALIGSIATVSFFFLNENIFLIGSLLLIISNLAFGASIVVYNSFLNQISTESEREEVSSKGWAIGYLGGGILLIINLIIFLNNDLFGISKDLSIRINLALAGFWWALFSIPSIINLREKADKNIKGFSLKLITGTFSQLKSTFIDAKNYPIALLFLIAYLFYNDGIQSVISLSSQFGQEELKLNLSFLTIVILIVQFVAALGALLFMKLAKKIGEKNSILFGIFIWIIILVYCYALLVGAVDFLIVAIFIALVMGGTQSISRSLYSKLIPKNKEAEYFSFYEISEKGSSWIGPLVFGLVYQFTLSYRFAILSLVIFFIIGGGILLFTKVNLKEFQKKLQTEE
jgi:UMF1 family MFS transporter